MTEDCEISAVTHIYAAWAFFMLQTPCSILFYVKLYVYDTKVYVLISTVIFFCSCYVWKAIFKKQHGQTAFISLVSYFL
jgi:hypothetical protein